MGNIWTSELVNYFISKNFYNMIMTLNRIMCFQVYGKTHIRKISATDIELPIGVHSWCPPSSPHSGGTAALYSMALCGLVRSCDRSGWWRVSRNYTCYLRSDHLIAEAPELSFPLEQKEMFKMVTALSPESLTDPWYYVPWTKQKPSLF